ncbi:MAG: hypothetical protein ACE5E6_09630 [Phycisphaerae bacterium]
MSNEHMSVCGQCGATVYPEHLDTGIARYEAGRLLCVHCAEEYDREHDAAGGASPVPKEAAIPVSSQASANAPGSGFHQAIKPIGTAVHDEDESRFRRPINPTADGATRCRIFHAKLNEGAIEFMTDAINRWIDAHDDIVVKFATSTIGIFEGKHADPNLILTLYY